MSKYFSHSSIQSFLFTQKEKYGERISHSIKINGDWKNYTYQATINSAFSLASTLTQSGLGKGDRVFIISRNRPEFCVSFFGCALLGITAVPVDPRMNIKDLQFIFNHSEPVAILTLTAEDQRLAEEIKAGKSDCVVIQTILTEENVTENNLIYPDLNEEDTALIIYTSGTTSRPKGVMTTFKNLFFQVDSIVNKTFFLKDDLRYLSILPLNHLFEFTTGMLTPFMLGGEVCYSNSLLPNDIIASLNEKKIREMICVPLFLKMLKKGIEAKMNAHPLLKMYLQLGTDITSNVSSMKIRRALFLPIHLSFGGELRRLISGGSSLERETEEFFALMGFEVFQGYGLTETSPVVSTNTLGNVRRGSVGKILHGVEVKTDKVTGEILVRGPLVMKGYFKDDELTNEVIDQDGWFSTGDVGSIDNDGYLTITGRIKELIVLPNGKKVAPHDVEEELLKDNIYLKEACVIGLTAINGPMKGNEELCAVVVPHEAYKDLSDKDITDLLKEKIKEISAYKRPARIIVQKMDLEKTSTLKIKRLLIRTRLESAQEELAKLASEAHMLAKTIDQKTNVKAEKA